MRSSHGEVHVCVKRILAERPPGKPLGEHPGRLVGDIRPGGGRRLTHGRGDLLGRRRQLRAALATAAYGKRNRRYQRTARAMMSSGKR